MLAVPAALAAAACFAFASVLQQRAARTMPDGAALRPRLLVYLLHRRIWLFGLAASAAGFALQALALHYGGLLLIQPLITTELLFALPLAVRLRGRRMGRREWAASTALAGGLALFLIMAAPNGGRPDPPLTAWSIVAGCTGAGAGGCLIAARVSPSTRRATLLGAGAGVLFGLLAALLADTSYLFAHRGVEALSSWQPYLLAVVAGAGELLTQSAYQAAPLAASLPAIDTIEPIVAIAIGAGAFGERVTLTPLAIGAEVVGLAAVLAAIIVLDRSPLVLGPAT